MGEMSREELAESLMRRQPSNGGYIIVSVDEREDIVSILRATPSGSDGGVRSALANALDSPTIADLAAVFGRPHGARITSYSEQVAEILAPRLAALSAEPREGEPVAWAVFAENGNIRMWSTINADVEGFAAQIGAKVTPLYATPPRADATAGREEIARTIATELGVTFDVEGEPPALGEIANRDDCIRIAGAILANIQARLIFTKCTSPDGTFVHASMADVLRALSKPQDGGKEGA